MAIILITIIICWIVGINPLRLLQKIGKGFFTLIGLWVILMIILGVWGLIVG